jgi:hypothetical protein
MCPSTIDEDGGGAWLNEQIRKTAEAVKNSTHML